MVAARLSKLAVALPLVSLAACQGTDANSRDELEGWVRRRAEELCRPKVAEVVIEQSDWIGSRVYWQMSSWPLGAMPRGGAGTFPKVMGRVTCVARP